MNTKAVGTGTPEAIAEFWRRVSFTSISIIIAGLGYLLIRHDGDIEQNTDSINGILTQMALQTRAIESLTTAQGGTTVQLAELTGQLEALKDMPR